MTGWTRFWLLAATVLFLSSTAATVYFITREAKVEKALPVIEKVGSPCRTAKARTLANRRPGDAYWDAVRHALHAPECKEQSDLVIWSYCLRHGTPPDLCDLPEGLRPERPQGGGDGKGGDASSSPPPGSGQVGGIHAPDLPDIDLPPPAPPPHSPSAPEPSDPIDDLLDPACARIHSICNALRPPLVGQ